MANDPWERMIGYESPQWLRTQVFQQAATFKENTCQLDTDIQDVCLSSRCYLAVSTHLQCFSPSTLIPTTQKRCKTSSYVTVIRVIDPRRTTNSCNPRKKSSDVVKIDFLPSAEVTNFKHLLRVSKSHDVLFSCRDKLALIQYSQHFARICSLLRYSWKPSKLLQ